MPTRRSPRALRWTLALVAALAATTAVPDEARAVDDPGLVWWTYETRHFRVHHPHNLDPVARRVAMLCETIRERLVAELGYEPDHATEILLTDNVDSANGSATPVPYDAIRLFITAPSDLSALGDYDDWYLELVTHEFTHTLHTGNITGGASIFNAVFGRTLAPNSANPRWLIEGLATVQETEHTSGGRVRSSLFDTFMRADVLEDRIARLDQISGNPYRYPQGNLWYLYGSKFLRWVTDLYGPDTMAAVSADYGASLAPFGVNRAIRRVTGRTYDQLYDGWVEHIRLHYAEQVRGIEARGLREGTRITFRGGNASYPVFVPRVARRNANVPEVIYYQGDQQGNNGLYRFELDGTGTPGDVELFVRTTSDAHASYGPDGELLWNQTTPFLNIYSRNDLYRMPRGRLAEVGNEPWRERLTWGLRASDPDVSPDGRQMVFTINKAGTSYLSIAPVRQDGALEGRRTLVPSARFDQAYTPRFSPDGKLVAYSVWSAGGYRDIRVVEVASGRFWQITKDRSLDLQPVWSRDGRRLYWSSDRTGVFNVFVHDFETNTDKQVTNVRGAALMPAISDDERTLVYVGYTSYGYDLFSMRNDPAKWLDAPPPPTDRPRPPAEPRPIETVRQRYNPLPTFGPRSYFFSVAPGDYSSTAITLQASAGDIAGLHNASVQLGVDPEAPLPTFSLGYSYLALPFDLGFSLSRTVRPRGGYVVAGEERLYDETAASVAVSVGYSLSGNFVSQALSLSYTASLISAELPFPADVSPYAVGTTRPPEGFLGTLRAAYSVSTAEGALTAPGSYRGSSVRFSATYAGKETGSEQTLYGFELDTTSYVPMPWPGYHVLAIRGGAGIVEGTYARRGYYYVGGYDLEQSAIDVLSGALDGSFALRGYPASAYRGSGYFLNTLEYRAPLLQPDVGLSTLPLYLRRIDAALFFDWGGAFDRFHFEDVDFFRNGSIINSAQLHSAAGGELWFGATLAHRADMMFRLGWAYGFDRQAVPGGQLYFILNSAF